MKKIMLILLLFAFTFPVVGQEVDSVKTTKNQLIDLDVHFLGLGLTIHQPINEKYAFTYGIQGGFILNYFLVQTKERSAIRGYVELLGFNIGIIFNRNNNWEHSINLKLGLLPFIAEGTEFTSPYGGISFRIFYKVSTKSSIGTNLDFGVIKFNHRPILNISTSFITYRIKIGN